MRVPLTPYAWREIGLFGLPLVLVGVGLLLFAHPALALIPAAGLAFVLNFFRDPARHPPEDRQLVVSPADGLVSHVEEIESEDGMEEPALKVSIFLNVFNVHINRSPLAGRVKAIRYRPGRFLDARDPRCGKENEANRVSISPHAAPGTYVVVRQISGAIARRIVCPLGIGEDLMRAQRFGMIKFGSRTELLIPKSLSPEPLVRPGDRVKGGCTPLARIPGFDAAARPEDRSAPSSPGLDGEPEV